MTWLSHSTIATAIVLPINPVMLPVIVAGSTAPDWLENLFRFFGFEIEHRKETHYLSHWIILIIISFLVDFRDIIFWFAIGGFTHILEDSLTISGVPLSPWNSSRFHLFGGALQETAFYKFRTGSLNEYIIAFFILGFSIFLVNPNLSIFKKNNEFNPYLTNYKKLHKERIIDEREYKENRFNFF